VRQLPQLKAGVAEFEFERHAHANPILVGSKLLALGEPTDQGSDVAVVARARDGRRAGGILLGSAVGAMLTSWLDAQAIVARGWRVPFIIGIAVGLTGLYIRRQVDASRLRSLAKKTKDGLKVVGGAIRPRS
jgi:MFS family permease